MHAHHARSGKGCGTARGCRCGRYRGHDDQERNSISGVNHSLKKKKKKETWNNYLFLMWWKGYYSRDCHALKHLVDLYQVLLKKEIEKSRG